MNNNNVLAWLTFDILRVSVTKGTAARMECSVRQGYMPEADDQLHQAV